MEGAMYSFTDKQLKDLQAALANSQGKANYQRVMAIWLRAKCEMNARDVADAVGWSVNSVHQIQSRYFKEGSAIFDGPGRGGRRNENLSFNQEDKLLAPFLKTAEKGGGLIVSEIQSAYERKIAKQVPPSTVYRMLARHGWRKIAPRPSHPRADIEAQETFKKTS
jgi:transposase